MNWEWNLTQTKKIGFQCKTKIIGKKMNWVSRWIEQSIYTHSHGPHISHIKRKATIPLKPHRIVNSKSMKLYFLGWMWEIHWNRLKRNLQFDDISNKWRNRLPHWKQNIQHIYTHSIFFTKCPDNCLLIAESWTKKTTNWSISKLNSLYIFEIRSQCFKCKISDIRQNG